jgi:hypothetical protein
MCGEALSLAAVLVLEASQTPTGALAFEHGRGAAFGSHFGHGHFGPRIGASSQSGFDVMYGD